MSSIVVAGDTSGSVTLQAPAVAGSTVINLPSGGGTYNMTAFAAGTALIFQQTTAPTGWTKVITNNDAALRIVSGTAGTGGTVAFTTAFSAANTVDGTAISTAQMPVHNHGVTDPGHAHTIGAYTTNNEAAGYGLTIAGGFTNRILVNTTAGQGTSSVGTSISIQNTGSGSTHNHTLANLAVKYVDAIICTKD